MQNQQSYELAGLAAYFPKYSLLAIADLHIGIEEEMAKKGVMVPKIHFAQIESQIKFLLKRFAPKKVVIVGDIKHEFGTISDAEWRETLKIIDMITKESELILVKGNHDAILGPIANKRKVKIVDFYSEGNLLFMHGDRLPDDIIGKDANSTEINKIIDGKTALLRKAYATPRMGRPPSRLASTLHENSQESQSDSKILTAAGRENSIAARSAASNLNLKKINTIIIGHEHPAVTLEYDGRKERYKCYLIGKWKGKELIVLPSFNPINEGTNILKGDLLSPFLSNIEKFEVFIVGDEVYDFGSVREIRMKFKE